MKVSPFGVGRIRRRPRVRGRRRRRVASLSVLKTTVSSLADQVPRT